jgi:3-phenylpropionate/cinnamic acid dioxygenase small subunit
VTEWLYREAELLDDGHEVEWLESMVDSDVVYRLPIRQTLRRRDGAGFVDDAYHLNETYGSLRAKVDRNRSPSAWTEDPPPRTRRFVTNVRVAPRDDGLFSVRSNLLIYRTRLDESLPSLIAGERRDVLRRTDDRLWLRERLILLDLSVLHLPNLAYLF